MSKSKKTKAPTKKVTYPTPVEHVKHRDKRVNIPTEELRDFVAEAENAPKKMLYPRDPSLDPQLVWKGKDEQDARPLEVPVVPIYIQEKIHPQAIIEDLRQNLPSPAGRGTEGEGEQIGLFSDFNGIKFEDMIEFYQHEQNWSNRAILGDSLLVMTSLAEKEGLKGKVQSIYFDPPYGIKFGSNWQVSTRKRDVKDGKTEDATRQPEQVKAFRDTWQLGIHSYLAYLRDRFVVCRDLLTESGSLFVQIGDENVHIVRSLLDEVFGSDNFVAQIYFVTTSGRQEGTLDRLGNYILWVSKDLEHIKFRRLFKEKAATEENNEISLGDLQSQGATSTGAYSVDLQGNTFRPQVANHWKITEDGMKRVILADRVQSMRTVIRFKRLLTDFSVRSLSDVWIDTSGGAGPDKVYVVQTSTKIIERCLLMTTDPGDLVLDPTCGSGTTAYVAEQWGRRWITIDTSRVALALARTRLMAAKYPYYFLADSSEGVKKEMEITGRIPNVIARSEATKQSENEIASLENARNDRRAQNDIKRGFLYKRVPHVTLKSIANNEEIDVIHAKWQEKLEPVRAELNKLLKQSWKEWQVPRSLGHSEEVLRPGSAQALRPKNPDRELDSSSLKNVTQNDMTKAEVLLAEWWKLRQARQKEIDDSIARRADTELLYDQPYEDNKRIRVTGPFTVESLSPHRVLSTADENLDGLVSKREAKEQQDFVSMILDNLRKAGVQNTMRKERLKFERLDSFAGIYLNATGEYTESNPHPGPLPRGEGVVRRVAVYIGPEHGTVGPDEVKEAAKEAVQGVGFDLLIVCGFAFDPHVSEETKRYGKLTVLTARMNPDLAMGNELLKKTGAGNLFMVFGEPDIVIRRHSEGAPPATLDLSRRAGQRPKNPDTELDSPIGMPRHSSLKNVTQNDKLQVEIKGLDVYDPTTGEIRSSSTDDIACWFIDTNYNGESFFVRHAYFTGADEPYEKLKRALRAEIDEAAWSALYSTKSRPFDAPTTGKIAVKIINHYGDEVLKVFEVK